MEAAILVGQTWSGIPPMSGRVFLKIVQVNKDVHRKFMLDAAGLGVLASPNYSLAQIRARCGCK